jgi:hypothetical protein
MLAIYCHSSVMQKRKVTLFPTHHLVLTTHCTNLPLLPVSKPDVTNDTVQLPIVPLCLPSSETFSILHETHHRQHASLARHSMIINGIWRNACALGICNDNLWDAIEASWGWSSALWAICSASIDRVGDIFAFVYDLMLMSYDTLHIIMNSQHHPYLSAHSKFTAS